MVNCVASVSDLRVCQWNYMKHADESLRASTALPAKRWGSPSGYFCKYTMGPKWRQIAFLPDRPWVLISGSDVKSGLGSSARCGIELASRTRRCARDAIDRTSMELGPHLGHIGKNCGGSLWTNSPHPHPTRAPIDASDWRTGATLTICAPRRIYTVLSARHLVCSPTLLRHERGRRTLVTTANRDQLHREIPRRKYLQTIEILNPL